MTLQISLTPETEARLREAAEAEGKDLPSFVAEAVQEKLAISDTDADSRGPRGLSREEWLAKFRQWVASHKPLPHEADDSRESIYEGRGE